jgi:hypothetical protein
MMARFNLSHQNLSALHLSIAALVVTSIGGLIRFYFILQADFPLNDGGLFHVMIEDLQANGFILPRFTSYNFMDIPYAYSPLPFYLAGLLNNWLGWSLVDILRILPAIISTLAIPVFFILSIEILDSYDQAILATIAYALMLPAFEWLVMGGGLTRSLANLFSLGTLYFTIVSIKTKNTHMSISAGLFLGLTAVSHQEIAMVTLASTALFFVFLTKSRGEFGRLVLIWGIAGVVTLPYFIAVASMHGITPFISAFQAGEFELVRIISKLISLSYTGEIYYTPFTVIAFLGLWGCLAEKKYLLPTWLLMVTIINPRSVERTAMLPVALLIGYGLDQMILPALRRLTKYSQRPGSSHLKVGTNLDSNLGLMPKHGIGITLLVVLFFQSGTLLMLINHGNERLAPVPTQERAAMKWVSQNTPSSSSFMVLTNSSNWASDKSAEWFPVLSKRHSVNTAQGLEWLPGGKFTQTQQDIVELKDCLFNDVACLENWSDSTGRVFTHIYLSKSESEQYCGRPCSLPIEQSLRNSSHYRLLFDNELAAVLEKVE